MSMMRSHLAATQEDMDHCLKTAAERLLRVFASSALAPLFKWKFGLTLSVFIATSSRPSA